MKQWFRDFGYVKDEKMEVDDFMIQEKSWKWWKSTFAILISGIDSFVGITFGRHF